MRLVALLRGAAELLSLPLARRRAFARAVGGALLLGLSACSLLSPGVPRLKLGEVRVFAAHDANRNSPVVLAVVLVADAELEKRLMSPDLKWFESDADLVATYPQALQAYRCELTPDQEWMLPASLFKGQRAHAVLLLAALGNAERRARIDSWTHGGLVTVGHDNWTVTPSAAPLDAALRPPEMTCRQTGRAL